MFARWVGFVAVLLVVTSAAAADKSEPIEDIGPKGGVTKVQGGFLFTEGPAADKQGIIYFSDIPANCVYRLEAGGKASVFREPSNYTNGNMFNSHGELVSCEMDGRVVIVSPDGKKVRPLAVMYQAKRFNSPNDLVVDSADGVYFTDRYFRAPEPLPQDVAAVYYVKEGGAVKRLIDNLRVPNGVILSIDEKTLYVLPSMQEEVMAYAIESRGKLGKGKVFCRLNQPQGQQGRGGDGLTIDSKGNLYIATASAYRSSTTRANSLASSRCPSSRPMPPSAARTSRRFTSRPAPPSTRPRWKPPGIGSPNGIIDNGSCQRRIRWPKAESLPIKEIGGAGNAASRVHGAELSMKRLSFLLALFFVSSQPAFAAFPGNGYWSIKPAGNRRDEAVPTTRQRRSSPPLDIYPAYDPHFDNAIYGLGLTASGGSAYLTNEYRGRATNMSYGYWDGGFSPGGIYSLSLYPHFDRPGFTYWQGGF